MRKFAIVLPWLAAVLLALSPLQAQVVTNADCAGSRGYASICAADGKVMPSQSRTQSIPAHGANGIYFSGTATNTGTSTLTDTSTSVATVTDTFTATGTGTGSVSSTNSASGTGTYSRTISGTNTRTLTALLTQTITGTSSGTATASSFSVQSDLTYTATGTATFAITVNGTGSSTTTATGTSTVTGTITAGQTATGTNVGPASGTAGGVATYSYTMSRTSTVTATGTITESSSFTGTVTQTATGTVAVASYSATGTGTGSGTGTSTHTWYPTSTRTVTSTSTATNTATTTDLRYETTILAPSTDYIGGDRWLQGGTDSESPDFFNYYPNSGLGYDKTANPTSGSPVSMTVGLDNTSNVFLAYGSGSPPQPRRIYAGTVRFDFWAKTTSAAQIKFFLLTCDYTTSAAETSAMGTVTVDISGSSWTEYTASGTISSGITIGYNKALCLSIAAYTSSGTPTVDLATNVSHTFRINGPWIGGTSL